ncbi:MAG TPA: ribosome small subunit-dependent GTPase A, partial [Thermoguttaceae bacterium]|nr:ribosome small subunit-dependent GTPase A [Thermoguttaceae bacterium]
MDEKKGRKTRADFRKNRAERTRSKDWTRLFDREDLGEEDEALLDRQERLSGKGELTRRRTVRGAPPPDETDPSIPVLLEVDEAVCRPGRV